MFNSLRYTKDLEEAGVARNQAEAHVGILSDMMASHFATTQDLKDLRIATSQELKDLRTELKKEMSELRIKSSAEMADLGRKLDDLNFSIKTQGYKITIKLGTIVVMAIGAAATIMTLIIKLV